jgi:hypothetical protein
MAIHFYCPLGHRLVVPDDRADKKGRCPVCQQKVIAPVPDPRPSGKAKRASPLKPKLSDEDNGEFDMIEQLAAEMLRKPQAADDKLSADDD